jgi:hypothetical protein
MGFKDFGFWDYLMEDMMVNPQNYAKAETSEPFESEFKGGPDEVFEEATGVSRYWTPETLVGEIVEDEPLEIGA